jgi:hypothetical protein
MRFPVTARPAPEVEPAWIKLLRVLGWLSFVSQVHLKIFAEVILVIPLSSQVTLLVRSCRLGHLFC